jgi:hypothetical protein
MKRALASHIAMRQTSQLIHQPNHVGGWGQSCRENRSSVSYNIHHRNNTRENSVMHLDNSRQTDSQMSRQQTYVDTDMAGRLICLDLTACVQTARRTLSLRYAVGRKPARRAPFTRTVRAQNALGHEFDLRPTDAHDSSSRAFKKEHGA